MPDEMQERPLYETRTRKIASQPTARNGVAYSILDPEKQGMVEGDCFVPTWDNTDHLHFACENCRSISDILEVRLTISTRNSFHILHIFLGCPTCGATGQRKIYLDRRPNSGAFQKTLLKNQLLVYGNERIPYIRTRLIAK
jgi:hypothetical protein